MGKIFIIIGILFIVMGVLYTYNIPFLGNLPGDLSYKGKSFQIYIPITTCIVISIILSLLFYFFRR